MIRCGPALPALLLCAYALGRYPDRLAAPSRHRARLACCGRRPSSASPIPTSDRPIMVALAPLILGLYGVGRLVGPAPAWPPSSSNGTRTSGSQRERRAELAVQADRARIAEGLDTSLNAQIVRDERRRRAATPVRQALARDIRRLGRCRRRFRQHPAARQRNPRPHAPGRRHAASSPKRRRPSPQPSLSQLDGLLARAGSSDVRLHVTGAPKALAERTRGVRLPDARAPARRLLEDHRPAHRHRRRLRQLKRSAMTVQRTGTARRGPSSRSRVRPGPVDLHHGSLSTSCPGQQWETRVTFRCPTVRNSRLGRTWLCGRSRDPSG